jgi:hypothetical protein
VACNIQRLGGSERASSLSGQFSERVSAVATNNVRNLRFPMEARGCAPWKGGVFQWGCADVLRASTRPKYGTSS